MTSSSSSSERSAPARTPLSKRAFDVLLSGAGLVLALPVGAAAALAIKLEDRGPVFFSQERVGKGGVPFRSYKFRSMVPDADRKFGTVQAEEDDPRVTATGRLLRKTAMDELPQLWNIFKGDMSFVGPRALAVSEVELKGDGRSIRLEEIPGFSERHRVIPGLTGIAQIFAPRDIPRRQKFRYDRLYVRRQSFGLDIKLILVSFWITFRGKWEVRGEKF
jgi:lipopolysaccharide/colanic/teichoic acid biosynthesis glycosyltransferase